jgi:hypothetical protein
VRQQPHHLGDVLQLHEVELDVLPGGDVAPAPGVVVGDLRHQVELMGEQPAVGDLDPHHLVVAALALAVDPVVQPEDAEGVLLDLTGQVAGEDRVELGGIGQLVGVDFGCVYLGHERLLPDDDGVGT